MSDSAGYIPVTALRNRPSSANSNLPSAVSVSSGPSYHNSPGPPSGGGAVIASESSDIETWRADLWDRDYSSNRLRHNSTRVQRTYIAMHIATIFHIAFFIFLISLCQPEIIDNWCIYVLFLLYDLKRSAPSDVICCYNTICPFSLRIANENRHRSRVPRRLYENSCRI